MISRLAASPRFAGSEAEADALAYCSEILTRSGYSVSLSSFEYSELPARWGPPVAAVALAANTIVAGHLALSHHSPGTAVATAIVGLAIVAMAGRRLLRSGTLGLPVARSGSRNLIATSAAAAEKSDPGLWIVAHIDSKSQTIPMLLRVASVVAFAVCFAALLAVLMTATLMGREGATMQEMEMAHNLLHLALKFSLAAGVSLLPVMLCFIGNSSNGAVDNASGLAAVLLAAELLRKHGNFGLLITSAEELGLAGARAFARDRVPAIAINCDTIDDQGKFVFMASGARSKRLGDAIDRAVTRLGIGGAGNARGGTVSNRVRPMIPGILADNIALTDAGWESVTISRGNLGTLARVHTSRDRADAIGGSGVAQAAPLLAAIIEELS